MKSIKSKLSIWVGVIFLLFSGVLLQRTYSLVDSNIENLITQQLSLALDFDLGIREYVAEKIRPISFSLIPEGKFIPETMSTSFVARSIFEKVQKKFPDYIIKFSSDNPRNPVNKAGPEELKMIQYFNENPDKKIWTGEIIIGGKQYFAKFSAMRMKKSCLRCHGEPSDAPAELIERYGSTASFYRPLRKVVGLDTIAIPSGKVREKFWAEIINNYLLTGLIILVLCISVLFVLKFIITDRLSMITDHLINTKVKGDYVEIEPIDISGEDEISTLSNGFNKLAYNLNDTYTQLKEEIEERKQAEKALQQSEERHKTLISEMLNAFALHEIVLDHTGEPDDYRFLKVNTAFEELTGLKQDNIIGKSVLEVLPNTEPYWIETYGEVALTGKSIRFEKYSRDFEKYFEVLAYSPQRGQFATVFTDITARRQYENALRESEELANASLNATSDMVYLVDPLGNIITVNHTAAQDIEKSPDELVGTNVFDHFDAEVAKSRKNRSEGVNDSGKPMRFQDTYGESHFDISIYPTFDSYGNVNRQAIFISDITEQKKMGEELIKAKKLESIGFLAGGIAHDFNNILSVIIGNIALIEDDMKPEAKIFEYLKEIENASLQAKELTKQLITFSKGGAPIKKIGSIGYLVKEIANESITGIAVKGNFSIPHDLWFVEFDEGQMKHAIQNVIANAVESMPDGGKIDILTNNIELSADHELPIPPGEYVKISIKDNGAGIPNKHLSQIFDPYFSTKEMGIQKGMGLGLATTYSIINRHDGHIQVNSEADVGTTFTLYLPAHKKGIIEQSPREILKPKKSEFFTGRILFMDDEKSIRTIGQHFLSRLGFQAEIAKNGSEAIELYKTCMNSEKPFEVLILDLTVKGGMGGKDTLKKILEINPQAKAIVSSGYSNDPVMTDFREYGFIGTLSKPYTMKELNDLLNQVISRKDKNQEN